MEHFSKTMNTLVHYNEIMNNIANSALETTDAEDEFLDHFTLYLAHALMIDFGVGTGYTELHSMTDIIRSVYGWNE